MLIDLPWTLKGLGNEDLCLDWGYRRALHRSYNLRSSCHHFISAPFAFQFVHLLLFFCRLFKLD